MLQDYHDALGAVRRPEKSWTVLGCHFRACLYTLHLDLLGLNTRAVVHANHRKSGNHLACMETELRMLLRGRGKTQRLRSIVSNYCWATYCSSIAKSTLGVPSRTGMDIAVEENHYDYRLGLMQTRAEKCKNSLRYRKHAGADGIHDLRWFLLDTADVTERRLRCEGWVGSYDRQT